MVFLIRPFLKTPSTSRGSLCNHLVIDVGVSDPLYVIVTGKVLQITPGNPYSTVEIEVQDSREPTGRGNNPYKGKQIPKGTKLTIQWGVEPAPKAGSSYILPLEVVSTPGNLKITLKGTPKETTAT